jgi:hypothetical protein
MHDVNHAFRAVANIPENELRSNYAEAYTSLDGPHAITFARCQALCGLAQLQLERARAEGSDVNARQQYINQANGFLQDAQKLDPTEQIVHIGLGLALLAEDNVAAARSAFETAKTMTCHGRKCMAAHFAFAQVVSPLSTLACQRDCCFAPEFTSNPDIISLCLVSYSYVGPMVSKTGTVTVVKNTKNTMENG